MGQFVEMDIFFFVTTVVVVAIGVLLAVILLRIWRILGHVEEISRDVSQESSLLRNDIADMRLRIKTEGFKLLQVQSLFASIMKRVKARTKRKRTPAEKKHETDEAEL